MQKRFFLFLSLAFLSTFFITSCTEDGPLGPIGGISPSVRLVDAAGFISTSATADAGAELNFRVTATIGDDLLDLLTIQENGSNIPLSRITYETGSNFGANPAPILNNTDMQGFTVDVMIEAPDQPGNYEYNFIVRDEAGVTSNTAVTVTIELTAPTVTLISPTTSVEADQGSALSVLFEASQGTADLTTISVYENENLIEANRLAIGGTPFAANPTSAPGTDNFQADITINVAETPDSLPYTYRIEVSDDEGLSSSISVEVLVVSTVDTVYTGVLVYNRDGEQFGGLNLYTGEAVRFNSADAQIRDLGIDLDLPVANNWLQQIRAINGAELKIPGDNQVENFSFENTNSRATLIAAYDNGVTIGDSDKVMIGDIFLVKNNEDYFILEVTNVVVTPADNNDYYEFSIKKSEEM